MKRATFLSNQRAMLKLRKNHPELFGVYGAYLDSPRSRNQAKIFDSELVANIRELRALSPECSMLPDAPYATGGQVYGK